MERGKDERPSPAWLAAGTGLVGVSLGAVAVLVGTRSTRVSRPSPPPVVQPAVMQAEPVVAQQPQFDEPRTLERAVAQTRDAVVNLDTGRSRGAGVIVHPRGIVVTNYHVIADALEVPPEVLPAVAEQAPTVVARFEDRRELTATVLVTDSIEDLAILRLEPEREDERFSSVRLGTASELQVGQEVFAIGNPFGLNHSVSRGIVSGLDRTDVLADRKLPLVQLDASINLGNSGGPLFALDGSLVGIVTLRRKDAEGIAFAVPVDHVRGFLDAVADPSTPRRSGSIGVSIKSERGEGDGKGYTAWVRVMGVEPESTAAAAGIREGDRVVEIRGKRLDGRGGRSEAEDLAAYLVSSVRSLFPGERLPLTIARGDQVLAVEVVIGEAASERQVMIDAEDLLGVRLRPGSGVPVIEATLSGSSLTRFGANLRDLEIVSVVAEPIESLEDLGVELDRVRGRLRQTPGPFWLPVGLRNPTTGLTVRVPVLVQ